MSRGLGISGLLICAIRTVVYIAILSAPTFAEDPLTASTPLKVVTSEQELDEALDLGGTIHVRGVIPLVAPKLIIRDGTQLIGLGDEISAAKLSYESTNTTSGILIVYAANVRVSGLEIAPTSTATIAPNPGIDLAADSKDISGVTIDGCIIHHVATPIRRQEATNPATMARGRIESNYLHTFSADGIFISKNTNGLLIDNNRISGRDATSQTHTVTGDGIRAHWAIDGQITRNNIAMVGRHAIQVGNSFGSVKVISNTVHDLLGTSTDGSCGIYCYGNGSVTLIGNSVDGAYGAGIVLYNDASNMGTYVVTGNSVQNVKRGILSWDPIGIAFNNCESALVADNHIGRVYNENTSQALEQYGMEFLVGCSNVTVTGNNFVDAGNRMLYIRGDGSAVFENINISGNTFRATSNRPTGPSGPDANNAVCIQNTNSGTVVCRDNISWYSSGQDCGYFYLINTISTSKVYYSSTASSLLDVSGTYLQPFSGSNLMIQF